MQTEQDLLQETDQAQELSHEEKQDLVEQLRTVVKEEAAIIVSFALALVLVALPAGLYYTNPIQPQYHGATVDDLTKEATQDEASPTPTEIIVESTE